jgi:hypothetical protein
MHAHTVTATCTTARLLGQGDQDAAEVTFVDVDTAAWADPELDVGNLLAHADLAALRRSLTACAAAEAGPVAHVDASGPGSGHPCPDRVAAFRRATRIRRFAIHALRVDAHAPEDLLR